MSAQDERDALGLPPALYEHALRLLGESPDGVPPGNGYRLPPSSAPHSPPHSPQASGDPLPHREVRSAIEAALDPLPVDAADLHRRFVRLGLQDRHRHLVRAVVADLPLATGRWDAARALARQLIRTGTSSFTVTAGLALLARLGEAEDIPDLSVLGLFRELNGPAVQALDALDRRAAAVLWLAVNTYHAELRPLVRALWADDRKSVHTELLALTAPPHLVSGATARRIAEASRLPALLDRHPAVAGLLAQAGRLLVRMGSSRDDPANLLDCQDVQGLYERVVGRTGLLPPGLDHAATLLSLAQDLSSGTGVLLDWPPGQRTALLDALGRLLATPRWTAAVDRAARHPEQRPRANWLRRSGRQPFRHRADPPGRLRIEVVTGDPAERALVEARILVDGRPIVPALFGRGAADDPEYLFGDDRLRAEPEPREVRLAEAGCTEGCCGALYVTIRRDGDQVVWENWRRPWSTSDSREPDPALPAHHFDAAAYDAELARAEADHSWSWPARTVARLIRAGLDEQPELLGRWGAGPGWVTTDINNPDTAVVTFWYSPGPASDRPERPERPAGRLQFRWIIPDDGTPPETQAAAALHRLTEEDPKTYSQVCGGPRQLAQNLGYPWPTRT
ncbi:hypothetical protein [Kitasatospora sp. NPDC097643]|uniref:hypothetical protein n=1 Tax=Kitasatospora sp. NPDC097643 TaxID=3157230 RepID=UPI003317B257